MTHGFAGVVATMALVGLALDPGATAGQPPSADVARFLAGTLQLSARDLASLDAGVPVVTSLPSGAPYEITIAGAARTVPAVERFVALARDIRRWKNGRAILQMGVFGPTPTLDDVAALTLDQVDFDALARCSPRRCEPKLAALAPEEFRRFDWSAPDAKARATALVRAGLVRHVSAYQRDGAEAMLTYADERRTSLASEFRDLMHGYPLPTSAPALMGHLADPRRPPPPRSTTYFYWARETFGMKPILSAYQVVVHEPAGGPLRALAASKQFFASRYFDTSLDVTALAQDGGGRGGAAILFVGRSRVDSLRGFWGRARRGPVVDEAEESTAKLLTRFQQLLER